MASRKSRCCELRLSVFCGISETITLQYSQTAVVVNAVLTGIHLKSMKCGPHSSFPMLSALPDFSGVAVAPTPSFILGCIPAEASKSISYIYIMILCVEIGELEPALLKMQE